MASLDTTLLRTTFLSAAVALSLALPAAAQTPVSDLRPPSEREGEMVEVDGASLFVEARGDGPPLMLLHGYPLSGALFARMRDALEADYTVITVDHRGYGKSEAEQSPGTIEQYATDALAVLEELGIDSAAIGGMSMGGPIVLTMYDMAPERFSSMILIDTIAAAPSPMEKGIWDGTQEALRGEDGGIDAIVPFLMNKMLTGETRQNEPAQADYLKKIMDGATLEAAIGGAEALGGRPDLTGVLDTIEVPTLVLVGLADPVYPFEISKQMVDAIGGNAELAIIEGASHAAVFEQPEASAEAIGSFLASAGEAGVDEAMPNVPTPDVVDDTATE